MAVGRGGLQVIDCTKWTISGTPPNNTNISTYNLSLTATDSFGKNFTRSLQLNIEPLVLTKTVSPTITPTVSHTSTGTVTTSLTTPHVDTIMDNTTPNQVPSSPPSSSSGTKSAESNNGLYIGAAIGGSIAGIAATSALILYCYKKRQKNKTRILPNQEPNAEVLISEETITSPDVTATRNTNTMLFSTTLRRTAQTYAPTTTERPPSNPVPFSLSAPSTLDGGELYPHYDEAESRNHSPSSRQFLVRQVP